ncbi:MAG: hypothetical protein GYA24_03995, partial [Candidatus Lokiarchaeota archaeon]|nr:hypothetical protein [Candidatus Lokiarchaeota archaeon]
TWWQGPAGWVFLGTLVNGTDGRWTMTADVSSILSTPGSHETFAVRFDLASGYQENGTVTTFIDTIAPGVALRFVEQPVDHVFRGVASINVSLAGEHGSDLAMVTLYQSNPGTASWIEIASRATPSMTWRHGIEAKFLPDGRYSWKAVVRDRVGHETVSFLNGTWIDNEVAMFTWATPCRSEHVAYDGAGTPDRVMVDATIYSHQFDLDPSSFTLAIASENTSWYPVNVSWNQLVPGRVTTTIPIPRTIIAGTGIINVTATGRDVHGSMPWAATSWFRMDPFGDAVAPAIATISPVPGSVHGGSVLVAFNVTDAGGAGVMFIDIFSNIAPAGKDVSNASMLARLAPSVDGAYRFDTALASIVIPPGNATIIIRAVDRSWNVAITSIPVVIAPPVVNVTAGARYQTAGASRIFTIRAIIADQWATSARVSLVNASGIEVATVSAPVTGGVAMFDVPGLPSTTLSLSLEISGSRAGESCTYSWFDGTGGKPGPVVFSIDDDVPRSVSILSGLVPAQLVTGIVTLNLSALDDDPDLSFGLTIDGDPWQAMYLVSGQSMRWFSFSNITAGWHDVQLTCTDSVGNIGHGPVYHVLIESTPPVLASAGIMEHDQARGFATTRDNVSFWLSASDPETPITRVEARLDGEVAWWMDTWSNHVNVTGTISLAGMNA